MQEEIFADAIGEIQVANNVVRIDFVSLSPTERDAKNNPKTVFRQRVVMPIDTFGNAAELIRTAMEGLLKSGAMRHPEKPTTRAASRGTWDKQTLLEAESPVRSSNEKTNDVSPSSPNFAPA
jgi:hypothetical protein